MSSKNVYVFTLVATNSALLQVTQQFTVNIYECGDNITLASSTDAANLPPVNFLMI